MILGVEESRSCARFGYDNIIVLLLFAHVRSADHVTRLFLNSNTLSREQCAVLGSARY